MKNSHLRLYFFMFLYNVHGASSLFPTRPEWNDFVRPNQPLYMYDSITFMDREVSPNATPKVSLPHMVLSSNCMASTQDLLPFVMPRLGEFLAGEPFRLFKLFEVRGDSHGEERILPKPDDAISKGQGRVPMQLAVAPFLRFEPLLLVNRKYFQDYQFLYANLLMESERVCTDSMFRLFDLFVSFAEPLSYEISQTSSKLQRKVSSLSPGKYIEKTKPDSNITIPFL
ncbi:hypothetical protein VNO77_39475 [Canavalia gladiata]|uniref:Uncharacterized protein n=1 Tax=Canavalia gladiata TaxID=3824 RepID=A0AAN9KD62_CANGL